MLTCAYMDKRVREVLEAAAEVLGTNGWFRRSEDVTWAIQQLDKAEAELREWAEDWPQRMAEDKRWAAKDVYEDQAQEVLWTLDGQPL